MTYNIPGVFTSVIDRSYVQPLIVEGRSVLIAGFSKYGEDKFYEFADADTMKFSLGDMDIKRYGFGLMYGLDSLTKTRNVIFKRLLPDDATFANLEYKTDGTTETWPDIINTDTIKAFMDADAGITLPPLVPTELEVKSTDGQTSIFVDYNPDNVVVYLDGMELPNAEYSAVNGQEILFTQPLVADKILNIYTVFDNIPAGDPDAQWVNYEYTELAATNSTISIPNGYDPAHTWVTRNGIELFNNEYNATDGSTIIFNTALIQGDIIKVHGVVDNTGLGTVFRIEETVINADTTVITVANEYNPAFTLLTIEGVILGKDDYRADDGFNIYFSTTITTGQTVRLHTIEPGDFDHYYGSLFAKAAGEGYNDLYIGFRPATDVERFYSDEEGDPRYKFNFLAATIFEQTSAGQKKVSNEFIVSLIDEDPESLMPIISNITGESLYINDKFGVSNEFVDFYLNESFLPSFKENLNIDTLTQNSLGVLGANRLILKNSVGAVPPGGTTVQYSYRNNIELVVNSLVEFEKRSTIIEGNEVIYTYYNDPSTGGTPVVVGIRAIDGKITINNESSIDSIIYPLYLDGFNSFYSSYIKPNPNVGNPTSGDLIFSENSQYIIDSIPYTMPRQNLYNQLIGNQSQTALWQLQSGSNGLNLIRDGRLNMGYSPGDLINQDAKQLLIEFYNDNEVVHEVLYPELDFDYVPDWTQDIDVMNSIVEFADEIGFTMPIISLPRQTNYQDDYLSRIEDVYLSSYNTMLYSGQNNDNHYNAEMGLRISAPSSYYALLNHLDTDAQISITEPMANIVKGQLPVAGAQLAYIAKSANIEKLRGVQINTIIKEIDGIYFIDQLTAYKSASKLSRGNVVKVIHRMRKDLPKILKDLLQRKALENVIASAKNRTEKYMSRWLVTDNNTVDGIFSEINVTPLFVEEELKLIVSIAVRPIGTIEKIEVPITVY